MPTFFFLVRADGLSVKDLELDPEETAGVRFVRPDEVVMEDLAFESTRMAIGAYLEYKARIRVNSPERYSS